MDQLYRSIAYLWVGFVLAFVPQLRAEEQDTGNAQSGQQPAPEQWSELFDVRLVGVNDDCTEVRFEIKGPDQQRVKTLRGFVTLENPEGESAYFAHYAFADYPFDRDPTLSHTMRLGASEEKLTEQLKQSGSAGYSVTLKPTAVVFDPITFPARPVEIERSADETSLAFEVRAGDIVFVGLSSQRWGRSWIEPLDVTIYGDDSIAAKAHPHIVIEKVAEKGKKQWKLSVGTVGPDWGGHVVMRSDVERKEESAPVRCQPIPVAVEGLELFWIPFRHAGERTDGLWVAIGDSLETLKQNVRLAPQHRTYDWAERMHSPAGVRSRKKDAE